MSAGTQAMPERPSFWPAVPDRMEQLGIPRPLLTDLTLRHIRVQGTSSLAALSASLKVSIPVVESLFHYLRQHQFLDVEGMIGNDYSFRLTQKGREASSERSALGNYAGPVPVSFEEYARATRAQAAHPKPSRAMLKEVFSDMVITDRMLDELGPSLVTHKSIFLYGPTGNGKTSIAERLLRVYKDCIVMPYAVQVGGHVINVYDPAVHQEIQVDDEYLDRRWVVCRRPFILVGGELVNSMLELRLDENSGVYAAPLQMKANNGIFVIDDFGRQVISPRELLNRWIIPLDRRVDYLTLSHGVKFQIPFELLVVFSTNISPSELADEAFLRRIHTKVYVDAVGPNEFDQIFARLIGKKNIPADPGSSETLRDMCKQYSESGGLRACYPGDIIEIVQGICDYEGRPAHITREELLRAVGLYFTRHD